MRRSTDYFLSSHGGNLPRPTDLDALLAKADQNREAIDKRLPGAVQECVDHQIACGVDIVNDGEYVKAANMGSYAGYIHGRLTGYESKPRSNYPTPKRAGVGERDRREFPGFYESGLWLSGSGGVPRPGFGTPGKKVVEPANVRVCTGPLKYTGQEAIKKDIDALKTALKGKSADGFIAALGPLSLGAAAYNEHYANETDYMMAVADLMREEYKAITDAGLIVQVDEPEFATSWMFYPDWSVEQYRKFLGQMVEVINHAIRGLPEDQIRFHMCWGSGHRPHTQDIEFKYIADILVTIKAQAYSFEASNVRHEHEYHVFETLKLPPGKIIVPGVVGHQTDLVEHPELVAERLVNFAKLVGMENVHAGTDCGIGSRVGHEEIAWAKLKAMADGCRIAAKRIKGK
jgi:5-methyltetrahydropteroyltriglutamate--homocysteine methyltransferase